MKDEIYKYIEEIALKKGVIVDGHTNLFDVGILDSLGIITLLKYLQDKKSLSFSSNDLQFENFETINSIAEWAESKG